MRVSSIALHFFVFRASAVWILQAWGCGAVPKPTTFMSCEVLQQGLASWIGRWLFTTTVVVLRGKEKNCSLRTRAFAKRRS